MRIAQSAVAFDPEFTPVVVLDLSHGIAPPIERVDDVHKRAALHDWLAQQLRPMFENRVLPVSEDVMFKWRLLVETGRKMRHTFAQPDLIIAATALHHGLAVVTRDIGGYEKAGVPLVNPWLYEA